MFLRAFLLLIPCLLCVDAVFQNFYWRNYIPDDLTDDALEAANGVYIGRVYQADGDLVATLNPPSNEAIAVEKRRKNLTKGILILCAPDTSKLYWEYLDFTSPVETYALSSKMKGAVKGGYEASTASNLYIGKVNHEGKWKIGKVREDTSARDGITVWNEKGNKVNLKSFYVLKYNSTA